MDKDNKRYSQMVFYTQMETVGERSAIRLKGIHISPRANVNQMTDSRVDLAYYDYDINMPDTEIHTATMGNSQYLYWLSTVSKEKESDPDIWRITGVYYDPGTDTMSDRIVIAEFTLPDSQWKGKTWKSVPFEITLTESGTGFITAKPNTSDENDRAVAPMTLYSLRSI